MSLTGECRFCDKQLRAFLEEVHHLSMEVHDGPA